jgi:hypothetical protein
VTFSPTSLTQTGSVTMTLDTSGNGHVASLASPGFGRAPATLYAALLLPLVGLLVFGIRKQKGDKSWLGVGLCVCGLALLLAFAGCGGGNPPPPPPPPPVVTPAGTYTINVTATGSNSSVLPSTTTVTLVVK